MEQIKKDIKDAADEAAKVIASAASDASRLVMAASDAASKILVAEHRVDHDILITLVEKINGIKEDIRGIRDDHEKRLRIVETRVTRIMTFGTAALLVLAIVEFLINQYAHSK